MSFRPPLSRLHSLSYVPASLNYAFTLPFVFPSKAFPNSSMFSTPPNALIIIPFLYLLPCNVNPFPFPLFPLPPLSLPTFHILFSFSPELALFPRPSIFPPSVPCLRFPFNRLFSFRTHSLLCQPFSLPTHTYSPLPLPYSFINCL